MFVAQGFNTDEVPDIGLDPSAVPVIITPHEDLFLVSLQL